MTLRIVNCRSCGAEMSWLKSKSTGKLVPVNAATIKDGDFYFEHERHTSHFATCPQAAQHRRPKS